jgi:hypothetical protein
MDEVSNRYSIESIPIGTEIFQNGFCADENRHADFGPQNAQPPEL